jgi:AAA+ superfamily predicted ATPase
LEVVQLCSAIRDFVANCAPLLQGLANEGRTGLNVTAVLRGDFSNIVLAFGLAVGPLSSSELAILGDLWCYLDPAEVTSANATQCALAIADRFLKSSPKPLPELPSSLSLIDIYDRAAGTQHGSVLRSLAFRLADLVAKADGVVKDLELQYLRYYEGILAKNDVQVEQLKTSAQPAPMAKTPAGDLIPNAPQTKTGTSVAQAHSARSLDAVLTDLNGLIGLRQVKAEVARLVAFLQVEQLKRSRGLKSPELSLHMGFYGNPGTGKTTVARMMAEVYRALGFVSRGHLIEAGRSKLIGAWLGQTAIKTSEVIQQALGGVLFIDEAYALARTEQQEDIYGKEAIETILMSMEDHRDDLVVIVAGYPDEMAKFFASNPGLKSRFNRYINFEDYSPEELFQIFADFAQKSQYKISMGAADKLRVIFDNAHKNSDKGFGNGRFARNLFESAIQQQALRIVGRTSVSNDVLMTIEAVDIPELNALLIAAKTKGRIGFEVLKGLAKGDGERPGVPHAEANIAEVKLDSKLWGEL